MKFSPKNLYLKLKSALTWQWFWHTCLKLSLIAVFTLAMYLIYLDGKVQQRFEGQKWQMPVVVYGQIVTLKPSLDISPSELKSMLVARQFTQVRQFPQPKQFRSTSNLVEFVQPSFQFPNENTGVRHISVFFAHHRIKRIQLDGETVESIPLIPVQLARLLPDNNEDRQLLGLQQVPEILIDTLLLVEDRDFYHHHGVVPTAILRAIYANLKAGRRVQGGSTLTQQLVKNMFLSREKTLTRKLKEALMALILEYRYSKDQLLEAYINEVYLGQQYAHGIYGFGLAAQFYFNLPIEKLSPAQMALLVAQIKGPSFYDPWRHPKRAKARRDLILQLMFEHQLIDKDKYLAAVESPLLIKAQRGKSHKKAPDYLQLVKYELQYLKPKLANQNGLQVFTGYSQRIQQALRNTASRSLATIEQQKHSKQLQTAMLVTDIASGEIRGLIGSRTTQFGGFNRALNASRQIGSLIKPIIYLAALERYESYNLATPLIDKPLTIDDEGQKWQPNNYDGKFLGQVSLLQALIHSRNVPTVNLGMQLGLDNIASALPMLGYGKPITLRPSMLLGAIDMTPIEINQIYLTLASNGAYQAQHAITHITNYKGEVLFQTDESKQPRLSDNAAYLLNYALTQVTKHGTAKSLKWRLGHHNIAGKTGTTNDSRDSWFIGYDDKYLVTTWVGRDDNKATKLTGSSGALVLYADLMKQIGVHDKQLIMPSDIAMTHFEVNSGNAVVKPCQQDIELPAVQTVLTFEQCQQPVKNKRSWWQRLFDWN